MLNGKRWIKLTGLINSPTANQTGTTAIRLPTGVRLHNLIWIASLTGVNTVRASFSKSRVRIGNVQRERTIAEHDELMALDGNNLGIYSTVPEGGGLAYVPEVFTEENLDTGMARENFALDLESGIVGYAELDYSSLAAAPSLEVMACLEPLSAIPKDERNTVGGIPLITKVIKTTPVAGGLSNDYDDLVPALNRDQLRSLHLYDPTGATISRVYIRVDGEEVWDLDKDDADLVARRAGLEPVIGRYDVVPELFKNSDAWDFDRPRKLQLKVEYSAAASGTTAIIARTWGPLE